MSKIGKLIVLTPANGLVVGNPDADSDSLIEAATDAQQADVSHLTNIEVILEQVADAGTVVLVTEKSCDGVVWQTIDASTAEGDFAAGANKAVSFTLSDANGMPLRTKFIRCTASALAGGGTYRMKITGALAEQV